MNKTIRGFAAVRKEGDIVAWSFLTGVMAICTDEHWAKVHCPKDAQVKEVEIRIID